MESATVYLCYLYFPCLTEHRARRRMESTIVIMKLQHDVNTEKELQ